MFLNTYIYLHIYIYMDITTFWDYLTYVVNYICVLIFQTFWTDFRMCSLLSWMVYAFHISYTIFSISHQQSRRHSIPHETYLLLQWYQTHPAPIACLLVRPGASDHLLKIKDSIPFIYFVYISSIYFTPFSKKIATQLLWNFATRLYNIWILTTSVFIVGWLTKLP